LYYWRIRIRLFTHSFGFVDCQYVSVSRLLLIGVFFHQGGSQFFADIYPGSQRYRTEETISTCRPSKDLPSTSGQSEEAPQPLPARGDGHGGPVAALP
jgi:hypothetical protein